ncbi:MAG: aminotransferase class I/II-fold pyridoxal phosphate-dependent enzyme [Coriobacteriales bacterium]|nr:aminotransferase class I/II-fold pyridoxal phosphate-dependent enzyme [Coriobacteriales bacterium]
MQAIILAAGMGKRLKDLTAGNTKCMVKVNGITLVERALKQLDELGLERIVFVVGYEGGKLMDFVRTLPVATPIEFVDNPIYDKTNNIYSLYLAKDYLLRDDTLLLESDIIFQEGLLRELVDDPRPTLALVDAYESWMDGTVVKLDADDGISDFIPGKRFDFLHSEGCYKTVNIYKFSKHFSQTQYVPFLEAYSTALGLNEYYEQVLRVITMLDNSELRAKRLSGQLWYEIDDIQDLDIAESMFAPSDDEHLSLLQGRYGGYWRYPGMLDFCYLVNPYYPPQRLMDEMKASFEELLTQYPSGMRVNSLLAAKYFGVAQSRILVGNGAAELIKALMAGFSGNVGFVRPTFEEYPNRYDRAKSVVFVPQTPDFSYDAADLISFFGDKDLEALVLINPDNPSGNYLPVAQLHELAAWCQGRGIRFILDGSFADFADEPDNSFIDNAILLSYPNMVVVKSISKSFGVPGVRLGVLASADEALIAHLKKDVAIWNINSFGEFYLQIAEKYRKDYAAALVRFRASRERLVAALRENPKLRVIPSQANYLLIQLLGEVGSRELTARLLADEDLLIKDLGGKIDPSRGQFIRVAIRTDAQNDRLVAALAKAL